MSRKRSPTETERHAALRAELGDPSPSWSRLLTQLVRWPLDQDPERAMAIVEASGFPAEVRGLSPLAYQQLLDLDVRPYLRLIRVLDLRPLNHVGEPTRLFERMIHEGGMRELHTLITRYHRWSGLAPLIARHITGLRCLRLGDSGLDAESARALAHAPALADLRELSLYTNHIDDDGAQALVDSPHLASLRFLNLYGNDLSPAMIARIRAAPQWREAALVLHGQRSRPRGEARRARPA
jgi:hypothetical protein